MSEKPDFLLPGTVIKFGDIQQLREFEDVVATAIAPDMTATQRQAWEGRSNIVDSIRPPKFNGRMVDVELEVMDEPYERLLDARERGWALSKGAAHRMTNEHNLEQSERYVGLSLTADAKSTRRREVGQVQAELWYGPVPTRPQSHLRLDNTKGRIIHSAPYGGQPIKRVITKPKLETEKFIELDQTARRIGFEVLREAMRHPIIAPHRG